ncbi:hypothetical protein HBB16_15085 [Pseudonocardia sp. MCCB 268]|nr:hypothetical protein [Pseudonocardia cytotoxica]
MFRRLVDETLARPRTGPPLKSRRRQCGPLAESPATHRAGCSGEPALPFPGGRGQRRSCGSTPGRNCPGATSRLQGADPAARSRRQGWCCTPTTPAGPPTPGPTACVVANHGGPAGRPRRGVAGRLPGVVRQWGPAGGAARQPVMRDDADVGAVRLGARQSLLQAAVRARARPRRRPRCRAGRAERRRRARPRLRFRGGPVGRDRAARTLRPSRCPHRTHSADVTQVMLALGLPARPGGDPVTRLPLRHLPRPVPQAGPEPDPGPAARLSS